MVRRLGAWTASAALIVAVSPARADNEDIEVTYAASARACPAQEDFLAMVRRHTTKWNVVSAGFGARRFEVRLAPREGAVAGTLVVTDNNPKTRELVGPDCAAVAEAVAIAMALAIDPESDTPPAPEPSPPQEEEPPPPPHAAPRPKKPAASPPAPPRPTFTFAVVAGAEVSSAVVQDALAVFDAAFEARLWAGKKAPLWLIPSLALGVRQSLPNHLAGNSLFTWTAGTIRVCPVRFAAFRDRVSVRPCGELDVGVLRAETRGIVNARSDSSTWVDLAGSLRGAFAITHAWSAGVSFSVVAPQTRQRYALETGELISQPPAVGVAGGLFLELEL